MRKTFSRRSNFVLFGTIVLVIGCAPHAAAGPIFKLKNPNAGALTLSDLIVYGADGQKKTFLNPGLEAENSADDVMIPGGGTYESGEAGFEIVKAVVSTKPTADAESRFVLDKIKQVGSKQATWLNDPSLTLLIDFDVAVNPPPAGTLLTFVNGVNPSLPGWFVGTLLNLDTGDVSGAFTGTVATAVGPVDVEATVPEPATLLLVGAGGLALLRGRRRGRSR